MILLWVWLISSSFAQVPPPPTIAEPRLPAPVPGTLSDWRRQKDPKALEENASAQARIEEALAGARAHRFSTKWNVGAGFSLLEMWTLNKWVLSAGYHLNADSTFEMEYASGRFGFGAFGVDVGDLSEQRTSLLWRYYGARNSFHFILGAHHDRMRLHLGNRYLATISGQELAHVKVLEVQTFGLTAGIGNRWQSESGVIWGFDWVTVHWPLLVTERDTPFTNASNSREFILDAEDAVNALTRIPALGVLKFHLGYSW